MTQALMTPSEIHDFGVEVVFGQLQRDGHEIVSVNTDLGMNPQIVARKDGQLEFNLVRTDCYPGKGLLESEAIAHSTLEHARKFQAACYFASVGIANASGAESGEMNKPVKGAGFYVRFEGLQVLSPSRLASFVRPK